MQDSAVYYPYVNFRNSEWLKASALLYDHIYRIIPNDLVVEDPDWVKPLLEDGSVGAALDPRAYAEEAKNEFLAKVDTKKWNAAALEGGCSDARDSVNLHVGKVDEQVRAVFSQLGYCTDYEWMTLPAGLASNYMLYLATVMAKRNGLAMLTDEDAAWTATTYFHMDGRIDEGPAWLCETQPPTAVNLFCLMVENIVPVNIAEIPFARIAKFRRDRQTEIANFRRAVTHLHRELSAVEDPSVRSDRLTDALKEYEKASRDYKKSADLMGVRGWYGAAVAALPAAQALAAFLGLPDDRRLVLAATNLAVGLIYSLAFSRAELTKSAGDNPFSLLLCLEHDFRGMIHASRGTGDFNFHLYNCMEEYIND